MTVDPEKLWAVVEKHASTVTLNFLCDLMPVVGMVLTVKRIDDPRHKPRGSSHDQ